MIEIFVPPSEYLGFVWNSDDWLKLRQDYRIVGDLIGSLSKYPRQSSFNGLPLCLQPEEVSLLNEKGFAKLIGCSALFARPPDSYLDAFEKEENVFNEAQRKQYVLKKKSVVERSFDSILEGKNKKRRTDTDTSDKNSLVNEEVNKIQSLSSSSFLSCIPIADPWINDADKFETNWTYPSCEKEKLKYDIFKDLWEKNYYITPGTKFGGDFLCYSGDPAKFHAEFIVLCVETQEKLSAKEIVTLGRIGTSTKKTFAIATKVEGNIFYQSLQWIDSN